MHEKKNILLLVDSDHSIEKMLQILLDSEHFKIIATHSGKQALRLSIATKPDLILLDLDLPDMDGKELIAAIREWSQVPIVVLTAREETDEIVAALSRGANDYVTKPFHFDVLLARINASLRACAVREQGQPELRNGPLRMDLVRHQVFLNEKLLAFTPKEYDLLRHFMTNCGKMMTHKEILKKVWGAAHGDDTTYLRVYVGQIREKLEEKASDVGFITTEPGIGYRMEFCPCPEEDVLHYTQIPLNPLRVPYF